VRSNVHAGGKLHKATVDFTLPVIEALERKVQYMSYYRRKFSNMELGTL